MPAALATSPATQPPSGSASMQANAARAMRIGCLLLLQRGGEPGARRFADDLTGALGQFNACRVHGVVTDTPPIFTIGHSTRSIAEFVDVLRSGPADMVVDVRTVPKSRRNPQYGEDALGDELASYQLGYTRIAGLGGLRGKSDVPAEVNGFWDNQSFHNYADYALSPGFAAALAELLDLAAQRRVAIMCAEAVWWRCHRRIIADHLLARGRTVLHLMGAGRVQPAKLTPGAVTEGARVVYPAPQAR